MVCLFGMSERLGPMSYGRREAMFLGDGVLSRPQAASEATNEAIDAEVASLVRGAHATARQLLSERRAGLTGLARTLEREETLEGDKLAAALEAARIRDGEQPGRGEPLVA
jgi:cell division protease FtsH